MKKITITYLSLLLILTSLFSTPISVSANTEAEPEDENTGLEVSEEESDIQGENTSEEEMDTETVEVSEDKEAPEETSAVEESEDTAEEPTEEEAERHGFSVEIEEALNGDGNHFTEEEGLDSEEAFILRLKIKLYADQNYQEDDVETVQLPASVAVAEEEQGIVKSNGEDIASYNLQTNGQIEFTFLEAVESAGAVDKPVDLAVYINGNSVDEEFAYIMPIEAEEQVIIPLAVEEEEEKTEEASGESSEEEVTEEESAEEEVTEEESLEEEVTEEESAEEEVTEEESAEEEATEEESAEESAETGDERENTVSTFAAVEENLLSSFEFNIINSSGESIAVENEEELEVNLSDMNAVQLNYGLTKPDEVNIADGDTYTINLPSIYGGEQVTDQPISMDGTEVASYSIVEGQIVVTFNESVNDYDNVEMNVGISGSFNTEIFEVEEEQVVNVPFRDGTSYTATIRAEQQDYDGMDTKEAGTPYILDENDEKVSVDRNPEFIDWTVRVNDSMGTFDNVTVIDDLGEHLSIDEDSFIVERIIRNYNNEEIEREQVDVEPTVTDTGFELNLGDIEDAYDISYTTSVDRPEGGGTHAINNDARIIMDGDETSVNDSFEGTWSGDLPAITKEGAISEERDDVIDWSVEYNFGQEAIGEVTLTDSLSHGEIDLESVTVTQVDTDIDGNIIEGSGTPVSVSPTLTGDGMTLPGLDADGQAYLINFSSSVPAGLNDTIVNTIADDQPNSNADDASVDVNTIPTGGKVGEQYVDEDGNPYIEWTITMNSEKIDVSSIDITDVFDPEYLEFDVGNAGLYELYRDGQEVDNFDIESYDHDDGRTGFTLGINDAGPYTYEFVYRTYYTVEGMQESQLANNAELIFNDGDGVGIGDTVNIGFDQTGPNAGINKSGQYITNEDNTVQEIEWTVAFNDSQILLEEGATINDEFTSGNYEYIEDSLELTTSSGNALDYDFSLDDDSNGFNITLNESTNDTITVNYRTTADDEDNLQHDNEATLNWQGGEEIDSASVGVRNPGIGKSGEVHINDDGSKTVNWTVEFNSSRNILHNVVLADEGLPATSNISDITLSRDGQPMGEDEYTVTGPADGTFGVEIDRLDAVPYQLTYSSTLSPGEEVEDINNTVNIDYTGGEETDDSNITAPELGVQKESLGINKEVEPDRINWRITANTDTENHLVNLVNPVLSDTIPSDQRLVSGTIKVVRASDDSDITETVAISEDSNDFSIDLPDGPYQYIVTFQTEILEYPSTNVQLDRYTNTTTLSNDNQEDVSDDAHTDYFADGTNNSNAKSAEVNEDTENIDWQATVNPQGLTINNAVISDSLSDNQTYVEGSIQITDSDGNELPSESYNVTVADANQSFTVEFTDDGQIGQPINISYSTRLNPELIGFYDVENTISLSGGEEQRELSSTTQSTATSQWSYGGGGSGRTVEFTLEKMHVDGEVPIPGATFEFLRLTPNGVEVPIDNVVETDDDGTFLLEDVRAGRYIVEETGVPDGYQQLSEPFHVIIGYAPPDEPGDYTVTVTDENWNETSSDVVSSDGNTLTVYNGVKIGEVSATKEWIDAEESDYPPTWFELHRSLDGAEPEPVEGAEIKELNSESSTETVTWENIDQFAPNSEPYTFSVQEVDSEGNDFTPSGFTKEEEGLTVTNTATSTSVNVSKQWDDADDQDGIRPNNVSVQLTANGTPTGDVIELNEANEWSHTFEDLREYSGGSLIEYSVEEVSVPEGYESNVDTDGENIVVTNTHEPETIEMSVSKQWDDEEDQDGVRPNNVTVNLLDGNEIHSSVVLNESNGWAHTFSELPKFNNGEEIQYSITENTVTDYSTEIETTETNEGLDSVVSNSYTPEETSATVTKFWDDGGNQDSARPESIEVQLLQDGTPVGDVVEITAEDDWTYTWQELDVNTDGEEIEYSVEEVNVPEGYTSNINDSDPGNMIITNSYTPETTEIPVTKVWDDSDDQDGVRPSNVTVNLLADGEVVNTAVLDAEGDWSHTFTDLPVNDAGEPINYSLTENAVEDYSTSIEDNGDGFTVTNTHTPGQTSATATKNWDDANNQDGNRPDSVEVQLAGDGNAIGDPVTLSEENDWKNTWNELDLYADGGEIEYSVEEVNVPEGYTSNINDSDHGNMIITNSYTPELTEIPVVKVWEDSGNQDGERPSQIELNLLNDRGEIVETVVVSEQDGDHWEYTFTDIPRYENGSEINYTVTENFVSDYSTNIEQNENGHPIVTNSYTPEETSVTVTKGWDDANNQDGNRPDSVEVQLTGNGNTIGDPVTLSEENDWTNTWHELDLYDDGEEIEYSVEEVNVPEGYTSSVNDDNHGNIIVKNSYTPETDETGTPSVSVGDYVWIDENKDGLQDDTDTPLEGVELTVTDSEGNPVTDVNGNEVGPTTTDKNGYYTFEDLPIDNEYIVIINQEKFEKSFPELVPTIEVEDDYENDSSIWTATSIFLDEDGQRDPTLDFGFVRSEDPTDGETPETEEGEDPPTESTDEESPGTEEEDGTPTDSADEGKSGTEEEDGTPTDSADEGKSGTEEEDGMPTDSTDEGKSGAGEEDGTPTDSTGKGTPESGEDEGAGTTLPNTGVALSSTIAIIATVLLAIGGALLFLSRRRNN